MERWVNPWLHQSSMLLKPCLQGWIIQGVGYGDMYTTNALKFSIHLLRDTTLYL